MVFIMSRSKWTEDITVKFVRLYSEQSLLWDIYDSSYKNKQMRDTAYRKLAEEMNMEGFGLNEVKAKIKSLRTTYNGELAKMIKSKASSQSIHDIYKPAVKWFPIMQHIMANSTLTRRPQSIPTLEPIEDIRDSPLSDRYIKEFDISAGLVEGGEGNYLDHENDQTHPLEEQPYSKRKRKESIKLKHISKKKIERNSQKRNSNLINSINATMNNLKELNDNINKLELVEDREFNAFGQHVSCELSKLSAELATTAQEEIQSILTRKRLEQLRQRDLQMHRKVKCEWSSSRSSTPLSTNSKDTFLQPLVSFEQQSTATSMEYHLPTLVEFEPQSPKIENSI